MTTMSPWNKCKSNTELLPFLSLPLSLGRKDMVEGEPREIVATVGPSVSSPSSCHWIIVRTCLICSKDGRNKLLTYVNFIILKIAEGKELIKLNKTELQGLGNLDFSIALQLFHRLLRMINGLLAGPPHSQESTEDGVRGITEALRSHGDDVFILGAVVLCEMTSNDFALAYK